MEDVHDNVSETPIRMYCIPCSEDNKQCVAVCFCTSCIEYLCDNCYANHKRFKLLRNHTFLKGKDMPTDIFHFVRMSTFGFCKVHSGREIEYKCINHSVYACSSCVTVTHRNCKNLECIDTMTCDKKKLKGKYLDRMTKLDCKIDNISTRKVTHANSIESKTIEEENAARTFIAEVKNLACALEKLPQVNLINFIREEAMELTTCLKACEHSRKKIENDKILIETVLKHGNKPQILMLDAEIRKTEVSINRDLHSYELSGNKFPTEIMSDAEISILFKLKALVDKRVEKYCQPLSSALEKVEPESGTETVIQKEASSETEYHLPLKQTHNPDEESKAGTRLDKPVCVSEKATSAIKDSQAGNDNLSSDSADLHSKQESHFLGKTLQKVSGHVVNVQKHSTKKCCHSKSIILENGKMVVLDEANCLLKLISKSFTVLDSKFRNPCPHDIAVSESGEIAVAYNKEIRIYNVATNGGFEYIRRIYTREPIVSISTIKDNLAILFLNRSSICTDNSNDRYEIIVQIRTFTSTILVKMNTCLDANGQRMFFSEPHYIRVCKNEDIIILEKDKFTVFGLDGHLKWVSQFNLQHLSSMTFDTEGHIYVCDKITKKIHQVEANGLKNNKVIASLSESPTSILFYPKEKTIIVGSEDNDLIHVYKFV